MSTDLLDFMSVYACYLIWFTDGNYVPTWSVLN